MWSKRIVVISDRKRIEMDSLRQAEKLAKSGTGAFVLREKDLSESEYYNLAKEVLAICIKHKTTRFLRLSDRECPKLGHRYFHMPLVLSKQEPEMSKYFHTVGISVHNREELLEAMNCGINYVFIGRIFGGSYKKDLEPRGLEFLDSLLSFSQVPLYITGGINIQNIANFKDINATGVCMHEVLMHEKDVKKYLVECKRNLL